MKVFAGILLLCVMAGIGDALGAGNPTYTFENIPLNTPTPLLNLAPDSGPGGFVTSFTTSPQADLFEVQNWTSTNIITGKCLLFNTKYFSGTPPGNLTLTFSTAVTNVSMVVEIASGVGAVTVTDSHGDSRVFTTNAVDGNIPVIQMNFAPGNSFTWMNLAFTASGSPFTFFCAGNITISTTPVPPPPLIHAGNGNLVVMWDANFYTLQSSPQPNGNFTDVAGAMSPYTNHPSAAQFFYKLRAN